MTAEARLSRLCMWLSAAAGVLCFVMWLVFGEATHNDRAFVVIDTWEILFGLPLAMWSAYGFVLLVVATSITGAAEVELSAARPSPRLRRESLEPPRRGRRGGATLISVLAAMAIIAICLVLVLQAYVHGGRFVALQQRRAQAAAACQLQIERARAGGYRALPSSGEHPFDAGQEPLQGTLAVESGEQPSSRTVTARVSWPEDDRSPAGAVELTTIMTPRGIGG
ncbi:MAG: type II secretion system protein [Armatimonadota bacterium]